LGRWRVATNRVCEILAPKLTRGLLIPVAHELFENLDRVKTDDGIHCFSQLEDPQTVQFGIQ
jgi:hypothetical protein